jgi:hypothetical protein
LLVALAIANSTEMRITRPSWRRLSTTAPSLRTWATLAEVSLICSAVIAACYS